MRKEKKNPVLIWTEFCLILKLFKKPQPDRNIFPKKGWGAKRYFSIKKGGGDFFSEKRGAKDLFLRQIFSEMTGP